MGDAVPGPGHVRFRSRTERVDDLVPPDQRERLRFDIGEEPSAVARSAR